MTVLARLHVVKLLFKGGGGQRGSMNNHIR